MFIKSAGRKCVANVYTRVSISRDQLQFNWKNQLNKIIQGQLTDRENPHKGISKGVHTLGNAVNGFALSRTILQYHLMANKKMILLF